MALLLTSFRSHASPSAGNAESDASDVLSLVQPSLILCCRWTLLSSLNTHPARMSISTARPSTFSFGVSHAKSLNNLASTTAGSQAPAPPIGTLMTVTWESKSYSSSPPNLVFILAPIFVGIVVLCIVVRAINSWSASRQNMTQTVTGAFAN